MRKMVKKERRRVNFVLMDGGLGDHVASLVALNYVIKNYAWIEPLIWVPNYLLDFFKYMLPKTVYIKSYADMLEHYNEHTTSKTTQWDGVISPMKLHVLDYAFMKLCDENPGLEHKNYLQIPPVDLKGEIPPKAVAFTTGYTAKVRQWPAEEINKVTRYVKSKGYEVVFLGQTKTETGSKHVIEGNFDAGIDFSLGENYVNKTSLIEAAEIMSVCKAVVGVDNGLLHLAGCTRAAIVGGFTNVSPQIRMPVRYGVLGWNYYPVVPAKEVGCCHCQQNTNFLYGHDYRSCVYKDNDCSEGMKAELFIKQLDKIL